MSGAPGGARPGEGAAAREAAPGGAPPVEGATVRAAAPGGAPPLLVERPEAGVVALTLNRPAARNCLSEALLGALEAALGELEAEAAGGEGARAVVLRAAGPAFSAGHDLKEMRARRADPDGGRAYYAALFARCSRLMARVVRLPQPVIAAVRGVATAAGCQLVASCDLAVAGRGATFATPGVHLGLFCSTPMVALSRTVGPKHALELLLVGDPVGAERALAMGLVNRVVDDAAVDAEALALARAIASRPPRVVRGGKAAFHRQLGLDLDGAYEYASGLMAEGCAGPEAAEGIDAFVEKRPPRWPGALKASVRAAGACRKAGPSRSEPAGRVRGARRRPRPPPRRLERVRMPRAFRAKGGGRGGAGRARSRGPLLARPCAFGGVSRQDRRLIPWVFGPLSGHRLSRSSLATGRSRRHRLVL
ncbi:MAG TPA: enoyl-CoA hydratase [Polyangiaceae bacterium]|nr:enoyl-CoA hydratase [Polyangiaceae bacterium]